MGKRIISLNDWIRLRGTPYTLQYFPDNFDRSQTYLTESELKDCDDRTKKWYIDYEELMECKRNPNYGRTKCFQCLLNPVLWQTDLNVRMSEENPQVQSLMLKICSS